MPRITEGRTASASQGMLLEKELVYPLNTYLISTYFAFSPHILELFLGLSSIVLVTSHCSAQLSSCKGSKASLFLDLL